MPSDKITLRWLGLLGINLLFFNTPAGSCANDLATGFPVVFYLIPSDAALPPCLEPLLMVVDAVACGLLVFLLYAWLKRRGHFKTPIGALALKLVVSALTLVNVLCAVLTLNVLRNMKFFEDVLASFVLFFYGPLLPFIDLKVFEDPIPSVLRIGLLPNLALHYFFFYGLSLGISRLICNRRRVPAGPHGPTS